MPTIAAKTAKRRTVSSKEAVSYLLVNGKTHVLPSP
jgi:hypothetical protein